MRAKPNILMIISHDTGRHLGCYGAAVRTPNLDRLAAEGIRFGQSFCVAAQCSPSRAALLTGRYPHTNGLMGLTHWGWRLNPDEVCLPEHLSRAGYETHLFGFQHEAPPESVQRLGYRHVHTEKGKLIKDVALQVVDFLRAQKDAGGRAPFFAMVGVEETHRPFVYDHYTPDDPETIAVPHYLPDHPATRDDLAWFHGSVKELDRGVGLILGAVDECGLAADTLVIYTTDHGIAFPRAKGMSYDPGLETALIMRWPGTVPSGVVAQQTVTHLDLLPTLLELVGAERPGNLHGNSYLPLLVGEARQVRDHFFFEMTWHDRYNPHRGIRTERYKYIRNFDADSPPVYVPSDIRRGPSGSALPPDWTVGKRNAEELYDLIADPQERRNLAFDPAMAPVLAELRARVDRWMAETRDPLLNGPVAPPPGGRTE